MSGLRRALIGLAVAGFALGLAALALVTTSDREQDPTVWIVLALTLGWGFGGAGLHAWWRRPENRIGPRSVRRRRHLRVVAPSREPDRAADGARRLRVVPRRAERRRRGVGVHDRRARRHAVDRRARAHARR